MNEGRQTRRETEMRDFAIPSEEEIHALVVEAARMCMAKFPSLAARYHDEGDLVGEFYLHKRPCMKFQTEKHVQYLRHHVFFLMDRMAQHMVSLKKYQPVTWDGGISLDSETEGGRLQHERFGSAVASADVHTCEDEELQKAYNSISNQMRVSKGGVEYSPRMVAELLTEGYRSTEIAEALGVGKATVSGIVAQIKQELMVFVQR